MELNSKGFFWTVGNQLKAAMGKAKM